MNSFKPTVVKCVTLLAEAFGKSVTQATFEVYIMGLDGLTCEQVMSATKIAASSCKFMPTPNELRELSGELRISDRAEKAWSCWEAAIRKYGGYKTLDFDDMAINAAIRSLGGVQALLDQSDEEYNNFTHAKFLKAYEAYYRMGVSGEIAEPLLGSSDQENRRLGYPTGEPVKIVTGLTVKERPVERIAEVKREQFLTLKKA